MKERIPLLLTVVCTLLLFSCSVQKRLYTKGFYAEKHKTVSTQGNKSVGDKSDKASNQSDLVNQSYTPENVLPEQKTVLVMPNDNGELPFLKVKKVKTFTFPKKKKSTQHTISHTYLTEEIDFEKERRMKSDARSGLFFGGLSWVMGILGFVVLLFGGRGLLLVGLGFIFAVLGLVFSISSIKLRAKFPLESKTPVAAIIGLVMSILFFALFLGITYLSIEGMLF